MELVKRRLACVLSEGLGGVELEAFLEGVKAVYSTQGHEESQGKGCKLMMPNRDRRYSGTIRRVPIYKILACRRL